MAHNSGVRKTRSTRARGNQNPEHPVFGPPTFAELEAQWVAEQEPNDNLLRLPLPKHIYVNSKGKTTFDDRYQMRFPSKPEPIGHNHPKIKTAKTNGTYTQELYRYWSTVDTNINLPLAGKPRKELELDFRAVIPPASAMRSTISTSSGDTEFPSSAASTPIIPFPGSSVCTQSPTAAVRKKVLSPLKNLADPNNEKPFGLPDDQDGELVPQALENPETATDGPANQEVSQPARYGMRLRSSARICNTREGSSSTTPRGGGL